MSHSSFYETETHGFLSKTPKLLNSASRPLIVVTRAYGLCLGAQRSTHQAPHRISGSELWSGATGSSRMALDSFVPLWQRRGVAVIRAYGLCWGAQRSSQTAPYRISGSELWSGATGSSRMASSRRGGVMAAGAGELLAWRPDHVGHEAHMGVTQGVAPGLWQGSAACKLQ